MGGVIVGVIALVFYRLFIYRRIPDAKYWEDEEIPALPVRNKELEHLIERLERIYKE